MMVYKAQDLTTGNSNETTLIGGSPGAKIDTRLIPGKAVPAVYYPDSNDHAIGPAELANFVSKLNVATKFDSGKPDWSILPFEALEDTVKVLEYGAKKYARNNWRENGGFRYTRIISSCLRHIFAFARGEDLDPETQLSHINHAMCNLIFLSYYIRNKDKFKENDDR